jgi:hypothetical protein
MFRQAAMRHESAAEILHPILVQFSAELSSTVERFLEAQIVAAVRRAPALKRGRRKRARILCYFPGCKNIAAPRHGMFCVATHKGLPRSKKLAIRQKRAAGRP